jgi:serine/threonine protein kinase
METPTDSVAADRLRHARVKDVFSRARDLSGDARRAFLDAECAEDEALRRDVELLLAADETDGAREGRAFFGAPLLEAGTAIDGRYRVEGLVAEGGLGVVYKLDRSVAVKVLRGTAGSDPSAARRFEREALAVARLRHPHVVMTIDYGIAPEVGAYLVMELVEGRSLREELRERERFPAGAAFEIVRQICAGIQAAHDAGVVHRDLKPENVAVEWTPEGPFAKVLDFGIATMRGHFGDSSSRLTASGAVLGTPRYLSPEQCSGLAVDARSDVYALGCVLYELLAGRPPFLGTSAAEVVVQHLNAAPRPVRAFAPDVPGTLEGVVLRALAKDPDARFQSADDMRMALAAALGSAVESPEVTDVDERLGVVFVVDDNPRNLTVLASILRNDGYRVKVASRGNRAIVAMQAEPPDLVMLDIQMPDMDGYDVCHELKADPATRDVPVIFISALDDVTVKVKAFKAGGIDYVTKPFQAEEVLARVESQLQIARLRKDLEASKRDLERRNGELVAANESLVLANRRADRVFSALSEALPGTLLDKKYRLEEKIGAGGFGVVYRAEHVGLKRSVAVKVFRPMPGNDSGEGLSRFEREGISACRVNHPNAIAVLDSGLSPAGSAYLVMELLEGRTLADEMGENIPYSLERAVAVAAPVCDALAAAHEAGIVHRDVKPENVFLHRGRGGRDGEVVKVLDFGLAKLVGDGAAGRGGAAQPSRSLVGTPAYIAPERLWGNPYDGRADVYSVGVVLYHMLCGEPPYRVVRGGLPALIALSVTSDPRPPRERRPDLGGDVEAVVLSALARDPAARPAAGELARALREFVREA